MHWSAQTRSELSAKVMLVGDAGQFGGRRETHGLPCRERPMAFTISSASLRKLNPQSNRFFAALPAHDFALLAPHLRPVALVHGAALHEPGDDIEHVYFPQSGMISLVVVMRDGVRIWEGRGPAAGNGGEHSGVLLSCHRQPEPLRSCPRRALQRSADPPNPAVGRVQCLAFPGGTPVSLAVADARLRRR